MPISDDTRQGIQAVLNPDFRLLDVYQSFLVKWMAFNRAYNDLDLGVDRDCEKVLAVGERMQRHWGTVSNLARQLVSLECIGGVRVGDSDLLKPTPQVKSATRYLRGRLGLEEARSPEVCGLAACRPEKQWLCELVIPRPWDRQEMAALLRLVYQVRCNLMHGDKRLFEQDVQTDRDRDLVKISTLVLDCVLRLLLEE